MFLCFVNKPSHSNLFQDFVCRKPWCETIGFLHPRVSHVLQLHVADEYDSTWVTCFQEQGEILIGISAQELGELQQTDEGKFEATLKRVDFQTYFMKFRIKSDRFNVSRVECEVRLTVGVAWLPRVSSSTLQCHWSQPARNSSAGILPPAVVFSAYNLSVSSHSRAQRGRFNSTAVEWMACIARSMEP